MRDRDAVPESGGLAVLALAHGMEDVGRVSADRAREELDHLAEDTRLVPGGEGDLDTVGGEQLAQQH
ncbi:MAG: hypothetical protein A2083_06050 [Gemmatimonadetes bacterium GWC2_71_9]|nr:MAG: hypothetical protein A2083_06050 [Gemmatimonadetes bacterium GWC2_71_9]